MKKKYSNSLAIESSTSKLSVSILYKDRIISIVSRVFVQGAGKITAIIKKYFLANDISIKEFDRFVVGSGPGSFTGLRIAFSVVKAFVLVTGKPAFSIPSFACCAFQKKELAAKIAVFADARRQLIYGAVYEVRDNLVFPLKKPALYSLEQFVAQGKDCLFVTYDQWLQEKVARDFPRISLCSHKVYPEATTLLQLAGDTFYTTPLLPLNKLEPCYVYPKHCQIKPLKVMK